MMGILYPKAKSRKKRKRHAWGSILQKDEDRRRCWLCMRIRNDYSEYAAGVLHKHHVFMGPLRDVSEAEGFFVWLCPGHHEHSHDAVHRNMTVCRQLQRDTQAAYERTHTRREFVDLIGRSYL